MSPTDYLDENDEFSDDAGILNFGDNAGICEAQTKEDDQNVNIRVSSAVSSLSLPFLWLLVAREIVFSVPN